MALSKAAEDPGTLTFEATVDEGGDAVVLSETYFYPEGGGQPADRGTIGGLEVLDVQTVDGSVVHHVESTIEEGDLVEARIDPEFRRYCMRAHTASHVLYGAGRRVMDDLGYGGFGITPEKVRVDFETSTDVDDVTLVELERLVNRCVWDSREVTWERLPREEALGREDVAFNAKTEEGIAGETVRVVEVDGWDAAACGGTHVSNTRELGPVTLLGRSNPGEGLTRIEFAVGRPGVERRVTEKEAALGAAGALGTNVQDLTDAVERLADEREAAIAERDDLRARVLDARLVELAGDAFERDGHTWAAGVVDTDANVLSERVRDLPDGVDVLVGVTEDARLAVGTTGEVDAGDVVEELTDAFGGGGGGSPTAAQAGGLDADGEEIVSFLRDG